MSFSTICNMKALRIIHVLFGFLALLCLLWVAAAFVLPSFRESESTRIEGLQADLQRKLEAFRGAKGYYPDSLDALTFTNTPEEIRVQPDVGKMSYKRQDSGYELSHKGCWYFYTLCVSNNGADVFRSTKERM